MMRRSLENENESQIAWVNEFKQQEDLKMHIQLPDYDYFRCYELGVVGVLSRIPHRMYANFHKPSWKTLQRHLFTAEAPKKLPNELENAAAEDKGCDFKHESMFGRVSKYRLRIHSENWPKWILRNMGIYPRPCTFVTLFAFLGYSFLLAPKRKRAERQRCFGRMRFRIG